MRVAVLAKATTFNRGFGGLETQNKLLCEGLAEAGNDVTVFSPRPDGSSHHSEFSSEPPSPNPKSEIRSSKQTLNPKHQILNVWNLEFRICLEFRI